MKPLLFSFPLEESKLKIERKKKSYTLFYSIPARAVQKTYKRITLLTL
jgi:hypothetical protein